MARAVKVEASVRDRMSTRVDRMERSVQKFGRSWDRTGRMASRAARLLGRGMSIVERGLHRLWRRARLAMLALQVTASIMGGMAVKAAMDYERAIRSVFTLMDDAGSTTAAFNAQFQEMDATLRAMSTRTKTTPQQLAAGLYDVVSTGFEAADAAVVLEAAARGAYAGLTDVDTAAGLLTQTLQAYRQEGESSADLAAKSTRYMDMFFNAVNVGVFTFEELGTKFGDVASTAAAFGVDLEDLLAFLSTATVRGVGLDEAITSARQTLLSVAATTPQAQEALEKLFGSSEKAKESFSAQALAEKGLIGVMSELSAVIGDKIDRNILTMASAMEEEGGDAAGFLAEKIGITVEAFTDLFPNVRALKGVLAVSGPGLETYAEHWEHIGTNMGAVDRAAKEIDKSASGALQGLKVAWEQFKIDVGNIALPWIRSISDNLVEWWGGLPRRFAEETGQISMLPGTTPEDEMRTAKAIELMWANASPGEKIAFILRTAWSDAIDNLTEWFTSGGGKAKMEGLGEKIGSAVGSGLSALFGIQSEDVENNIFYQIGRAAAQGFMDGFKENFDLGAALGQVATGDGVFGQILQGAIVWKLFKGLLARGGAGAAGGAAGGGGVAGGAAAAAGGGLLSKLFGGAGRWTMAGLGALNYGAISSDLAQEDQSNSLIWRALGMFGIGSQSVWGSKQKPVADAPATLHSPESYAQSKITGAGTTSSSRHSQRVADRQERAARDFEGGSRVVDYAAADMRFAGDQQVAAASKFLLAADRLGNVRLGFPGLGGPGSTSNAGRSMDPIPEALGGIGTVRRPTLFMAGESGAEDYEFTPHRGGKRGGGHGRSLTVAGPLIGVAHIGGDQDVKKIMAQINRELEKAFGNG